MSQNRTSPIARKAAARTEAGSSSEAPHEEMIPVVTPDGRWELVPGGPGSGDIFENPFATFTEWDSEGDREGFERL